MDDSEFAALRIRASLCPGMETEWEKPETTHWIKLHECGNSLRASVGKTVAAIEKINLDKNLSDEGRRLAKEKLATTTLDELEKAESLQKAQTAVTAQMDRWAAKIAAHVKPAADEVQAVLHSEIRQKVANMKEGSRIGFLQKNAADPTVAGALLSAPPFLSNLTEPELALLRGAVEQKYLGAEVVESKKKVEQAYNDCVAAQRAAKALIVGAAGLKTSAPAKVA